MAKECLRVCVLAFVLIEALASPRATIRLTVRSESPRPLAPENTGSLPEWPFRIDKYLDKAISAGFPTEPSVLFFLYQEYE